MFSAVCSFQVQILIARSPWVARVGVPCMGLSFSLPGYTIRSPRFRDREMSQSRLRYTNQTAESEPGVDGGGCSVSWAQWHPNDHSQNLRKVATAFWCTPRASSSWFSTSMMRTLTWRRHARVRLWCSKRLHNNNKRTGSQLLSQLLLGPTFGLHSRSLDHPGCMVGSICSIICNILRFV